MKELIEKVYNLDQALHACKVNNTYLKEKVRVLEKNPSNGKAWYEGQPAHDMYKKHALERGKAPHLANRPFAYPGKRKFGWTLDKQICTYCGGNRHQKWNCPKKAAFIANQREYHATHGQSYQGPSHGYANSQGRSRRPRKLKVRQPQAMREPIQKGFNVASSSKSINPTINDVAFTNPTKPIKVWVVKT